MQARDHRVAIDAALLVLLAAAAAAIVADLPIVRPLAVLLALLLVPGGALLTRLPVSEPAAAIGLAIGLSLAAETLVAAALAAAHVWEPWLLAAGLGAPAAVLLAVDLRRAAARRAAPAA